MSKLSVIKYYEGATPDYEAWSPNFNMHFGYWRPWMNPFAREPMLQEMNAQALSRLELPYEAEKVLDMGCGVGGTLRYGAHHFPRVSFTGLSIVEAQIEKARELNGNLPIEMVCGDYTASPFPAESFDGIYALESTCHAEGPGKRPVLQEMYRLLKPGRRFCIADGFLTRPLADLPAPFRRIHDILCENWAVPMFAEIEPFTRNLAEIGFREIELEKIPLRIGPTALHAPFTVLTFCISKLLHGQKLGPVTRRHLIACLLSPVMGMHPGFSYYLVSGRKPL